MLNPGLSISSVSRDDYAVSSALCDAWRCTGLGANDTVIPTAVPELGGVDLELDSGSTQTGLGSVANAVTFNGTDQRVVASTTRHNLAAGEAFLFSLWANHTSTDTGNNAFLDMHADSQFRLYDSSSSGRPVRYFSGAASNFGPSSVLDDSWHHFVFAGDPSVGANGTLYCYVDGVEYAAGGGDVMAYDPPTGSSPLCLGARSTYIATLASSAPWLGSLRDVQVYKSMSGLPSDVGRAVRWLRGHQYRFLPSGLWS